MPVSPMIVVGARHLGNPSPGDWLTKRYLIVRHTACFEREACVPNQRREALDRGAARAIIMSGQFVAAAAWRRLGDPDRAQAQAPGPELDALTRCVATDKL